MTKLQKAFTDKINQMIEKSGDWQESVNKKCFEHDCFMWGSLQIDISFDCKHTWKLGEFSNGTQFLEDFKLDTFENLLIAINDEPLPFEEFIFKIEDEVLLQNNLN